MRQSLLQPAVFTESRLCSSTGYHPLTSAIYISAGHQGREDTVKRRVKDLTQSLQGVLLVAAALCQRSEKVFHTCVENSVWDWKGHAQSMSRPRCTESKRPKSHSILPWLLPQHGNRARQLSICCPPNLHGKTHTAWLSWGTHSRSSSPAAQDWQLVGGGHILLTTFDILSAQPLTKSFAITEKGFWEKQELWLKEIPYNSPCSVQTKQW